MVKLSKIIAEEPKTMENPKLINIKSVFIEHPKTPRKLPRIINQTKKVGCGKNSDSSLYSKTKKVKIFGMKKT